jgi:hypothetical protein
MGPLEVSKRRQSKSTNNNPFLGIQYGIEQATRLGSIQRQQTPTNDKHTQHYRPAKRDDIDNGWLKPVEQRYVGRE